MPRHDSAGVANREVDMKHTKWAWIAAIPVAAIPLWSCQQGSGSETHDVPALVEEIQGTGLRQVTLSERAAERLGIQTATVRRADGPGAVIAAVPYSAVIYDPHGMAWVYIPTAPLTFVRHAVSIYSIEGDMAYLKVGPPEGTQVVSVGVAELFGTEQEIGARPREPRSTQDHAVNPLPEINEARHVRST
jgi:hypothetical protein